MIMSIDELIEFITESDSKEYAIIGNGGGGKSFLANKLLMNFKYSNEQLLNTDDYLLDSKIRKSSLFSNKTAYDKDSYFIPALERDLKMAIMGKKFMKLPNYKNEMFLYQPKDIKIFEGIALPFTESFFKIEKKIFIYTEKELELKMRLKRDNGIRGVPKEKILADFSKRRFQYESNYYKWMDDCDIIIKNMENKFDVLKE